MSAKNIIKEITPLTSNDCFTLSRRVKKNFDFPIHYHEEYELNLILDAGGAKRIVGDHMEVIGDYELVMVGPNLPHAWVTNQCTSEITEITLQWHRDLLDDRFLGRFQMAFIKNMLERSSKGLIFPRETVQKVASRIISLSKRSGFDSMLELLGLLHDLSLTSNTRTLCNNGYSAHAITDFNSRRLDKAFRYMLYAYQEPITLNDMAKLTHMTEASFSRFIRKRTGKTFIDSLNEIRLGHASRMLMETTQTISEISFKCGFNNVSNFNRLFRRKKKCTPREFRESFSEIQSCKIEQGSA